MKNILIAAAFAATPAVAADRTLTVTDFDSISIDGPFTVDVKTGRGSSGHVIGDQRAIDRISIEMRGRVLVVRSNSGAWGGWNGEATGQAVIRLTTAALSNAWATGAAQVTIDRMRGPRVRVALEGPGAMTVGVIDADVLDAAVTGAGSIKLAGRAANAAAALHGAGALDGAALIAQDAVIVAEGGGALSLGARRTAKVTASGAAQVSVPGGAACTVRATGASHVICGGGAAR